MRKIILLILLFYLSQGRGSEYQYVWNIYGIELKNKPTLNSESIKAIEFGEKINFEIIKELDSTVLLIDNFFEFSGKWLYVSYQDIEGYLFSGFLSSISPPKNNLNTIDEMKILGKKIKESIILDSIKFESNYYLKKTEFTKYENGSLKYLPFDGCFNYTYIFMGLNKNEIQNLVLSMYYKADAIAEVKLRKTDKGWEISSYSCT